MIPISTSKASDNRQAAADQGINIREGMLLDQKKLVSDYGQLAEGSGVIANPNSIAVGKQGKINTGLDLSKAKVTNLTIGDGGATTTALAGVLDKSIAALQSGTDNLKSNLTQAIDKLGEKDQLTATDGAGSKNIVMLILGALGFVVLALYLLRK